ncbi:MAG: glycosyltransferase [Epulopiscium sp.]|nr:glycosyltransferase [Candidatus Epulonipiscium sp.]
MLLSIVMMVKNEEKYLYKCLTNLKPILEGIPSELIILDTGSTDKTIEIAKSHTKKVYEHPWENDFAKMRNISISHAKGQWLFILDADEIVSNPETIIEFFRTKKYKEYRTCVLSIKNFLNENESDWNIIPMMRLFKNTPDFKYSGAVHEQPLVAEPFHHLETVLEHYGYVSSDPVLMKRKFKRNVEILEQELEKNPDNVYYLFQISQSYGMYKDHKTALYYAERAYELAKEKKVTMIYIYIHLLHVALFNNKYKKVLEVAKKTIEISDEYIDAYFYLGKAQQALLKNKEAIKTFEKYIEMAMDYKSYAGYKDMVTPTLTIDSVEEVYGDLCLLYSDIGEYEKVLDIKDKISFDKAGVLDSIYHSIILSYIRLNRWKELKEYYNKIKVEGEDLKESFINNIELLKENISLDEKIALEKQFSSYEDNYGLLSKVRIALQEGNFSSLGNIKKDIKTLDFVKLPHFYGDILWYNIIEGSPIEEYLSQVREEKIFNYIQYILNEKSKRSFDILFKYIKNQYPILNIKTAHVTKILLKALLLDESLEDNYYRGILERYVANGNLLMKYTYQEHILEDELEQYLKNDEERFLMYMDKAISMKFEDLSKSISYLKKALRVFPVMKKGIELYIDEYRNLINQNLEFNSLKNNLQININQLLQEGKIDEVDSMIKEYEAIIKDDSFIYSTKSTIAMLQNSTDKAKRVIKEGLLKYPRNFDLLCNGAYLCEITKEISIANLLYKEAYKAAPNEEYKNQIQGIINKLYKE